jgi:hypothetical protein
MPIVFDEISGEVAPERTSTTAEEPPPATQAPSDIGELIHRELQLARERELRLIAD